MADWVVGEEITADKLNENRGFSSRARAYHSNTFAQYVPDNNLASEVTIILDNEDFDGDTEFDNSVVSGQADATEDFKLHDADGGFTADMVGWSVYNRDDKTTALVTAFVDSGELTLSNTIMTSGEDYYLYSSAFTAKTAGYYMVTGSIQLKSPPVNTVLYLRLFKNGVRISTGSNTTQEAYAIINFSDIVYLAIGDYLDLRVACESSTIEINDGSEYTFLAIHRLS